MSGNEPIVLYASAGSDYSLLSWQPEFEDESLLLAVPRGNGGRKIAAGLEKRGSEAQMHLDEQMERYGGFYARVRQSAGQVELSTKAWPTASYEPPSKMLVLGRGDTVREQTLPCDTRLSSGEYALAPVDALSQRQLEQWMEGLHGLPADLRIATIQSIAREGVLDSRRRAPSATLPDTPVPEKKIAVGWWIALAALLGLAGGGAAGWFAPLLLPRPPHPPAIKLQTGAESPGLAAPLDTLEEKMLGSKDPNIKSLLENHLFPFSLEPKDSPAKRTAEAWMVLKLTLYRLGVKVDPLWSAASNQQAKDEWTKRSDPQADTGSLDPAQIALVSAAACFAGPPPAGTIADAAVCKDVKWTEARQAMEELGNFAAGSKAPPTDPGADPNPKADPQHPQRGTRPK